MALNILYCLSIFKDFTENFMYALFLVALFLSFPAQAKLPNSVTEWYHVAHDRDPSAPAKPLVSYQELIDLLDDFMRAQKTFFSKTPWLNNTHPKMDAATLSQVSKTQPIVLKCETLHANKIFFWGDLHGDIQALSSSLYKLHQDNIIGDDFKLKNSEHLCFFLGDLTDRGEHGPDTLALLFTFALKNWGKVFLLRGNHEDTRITNNYGFSQQLSRLYEAAEKPTTLWEKLDNHVRIFLGKRSFNSLQQSFKKFTQFYNLLPAAVFVGCEGNFVQCCHGGLDWKYRPLELLGSENALCLQNIIEMADIDPFYLDFLWADFCAVGDTSKTTHDPNRGTMWGRKDCEQILTDSSSGENRLRGVIRAHQHNHTMPGLFDLNNTGVYSLWNNQVLTTIGTGIYTKAAAFMQLTVDEDFDKWNLISHNLQKEGWHLRTSLLKNWKNISN